MRRGAILLGTITAGLALSHAAAWWLGSAFPEAGAKEAVASSNRITAAAADKPAPWSTEELLRRDKQHEADAQAQADAMDAEEDRPYAERIAAARAKIPPGTDLADYLAKAEAALKHGEHLGIGGLAAFSMWLDADPAAALAWAGRARRDGTLDYQDADAELQRWLGEGGYRQLGDLVERCPLASRSLLDAAGSMVYEQDPAFTLAMVAGMKDPDERLGMLYGCFRDRERLKGHVAAVRTLLGERQSISFLDSMLQQYHGDMPDDVLLEEIRGAGFPPAALASFEKQRAAIIESKREAEAEELPDIPEEMRGNGDGKGNRFNDTKESASRLMEFMEKVPEFGSLQSAMMDGRLTPQEMTARLAQAWPEADMPEIAQEICKSLASAESGEGLPVEMLRWLRESGPEGRWREQLTACLFSQQPEQFPALLAELPAGTELDERERNAIRQRIDEWYSFDPEGFMNAAERMAADERGQGQGQEKPSIVGTFMQEEWESHQPTGPTEYIRAEDDIDKMPAEGEGKEEGR